MLRRLDGRLKVEHQNIKCAMQIFPFLWAHWIARPFMADDASMPDRQTDWHQMATTVANLAGLKILPLHDSSERRDVQRC